MAKKPRFRRAGICIYEYRSTGYFVEKINDGTWIAYMRDGSGSFFWLSARHKTRGDAAKAISLERRRLSAEIRRILGK